jgi:UDP:flavonoid glycosyltransferase YjiC (YdhE family)
MGRLVKLPKRLWRLLTRGPAPQRIEAHPQRPSYLFFCVNGVGLGHLNRALAVARRIPRLQPDADVWFLTSSRMLDAISREGFVPYYVPPFTAYGDRISQKHWNRMLEEQIRLIFELHRPATLVYDGIFPYPGFVRALEKCRFEKTAMILRLRHTHSRLAGVGERFRLFNQIIHPGEAGESEAGVPSPTEHMQPRRVAPILYFDRSEILSRAEARRRLLLPMDRRVVYLQLGSGNINDAASWTGHALELLAGYPEVEVVLAQSPIANRDVTLPPRVHLLRQYPNALFFNAFDLAISAAGYNTVHELLFFGVPSILIPMEKVTDDQEGRARSAERAGAAVVVTRPEELADALERVLSGAALAEIRTCAERLILINGADEAARAIAEGKMPRLSTAPGCIKTQTT